MLQEVEKQMKREVSNHTSHLEQQIKEMERMLADVKASLDLVPELGTGAMRGVSQRGTAEHMARVAAQMNKSIASLALIADLTDAANVGTCEESGI